MHMNAEGKKPDHVDRVLGKPPKMKDLRRALQDLAGRDREVDRPETG